MTSAGRSGDSSRVVFRLRSSLAPIWFVLCFLVLLWSFPAPAAVYTVVNTNDSGPGSLREAIQLCNGTAQVDEIRFNLPGAGVQTIAPLTPLPDITNTVTIDGYSQPGSRTNSEPWGSDAILRVRLDGLYLSNSFAPALLIKAGGCSIRGLIVVRFSYGIRIDNASRNTIAGNWVGVDWDGVARGMTFSGVDVTSLSFGASIYNTIGGASPADRNVIGGNRVGVSFFPTSAGNNLVQGNFIGTDATGRLARGNMFEGVSIQSATNITIQGNILSASTGAGGCGVRILGGSGTSILDNLIGHGSAPWTSLGCFADGISAQGTTKVAIIGNSIGFNQNYGISLLGCSGFSIQGNKIGTAGGGFEPFGNLDGGISILSSSTNLISGNRILFNGGPGIMVSSGVANRITANEIHDNTGLGIDLNMEGVDENDPGDIDAGANNLQNFPVLADAVLGGGTLRVAGALSSEGGKSYKIEVFVSEAWDPWGWAEGRYFAGSTNVVTDPSGEAAISLGVPFQALSGADFQVTATATDVAGNTSEFSAGIPLVIEPDPPRLGVSRQGAGLGFSWPITAGGYTLESADAIQSGTVWKPVTSGIQTQGLNRYFTVTNAPGPTQQWFRLKK